ncbi:Hypothetical protein FKW44_004499 [Caligus rogercresseyi]|uniref:Uncharacterized protein n=1 Tax=Caligus rogercresseyi TaxID=217165 RepID=A0A7T8HMU5_CALRO|nr:Hypothetical protein FKW44_004499 [Caligus rogercresseyi]
MNVPTVPPPPITTVGPPKAWACCRAWVKGMRSSLRSRYFYMSLQYLNVDILGYL